MLALAIPVNQSFGIDELEKDRPGPVHRPTRSRRSNGVIRTTTSSAIGSDTLLDLATGISRRARRTGKPLVRTGPAGRTQPQESRPGLSCPREPLRLQVIRGTAQRHPEPVTCAAVPRRIALCVISCRGRRGIIHDKRLYRRTY